MKPSLPICLAGALLLATAACGPPIKAPQPRVPDRVPGIGPKFTGHAEVGRPGQTTQGERDLDGDGVEDCWRLIFNQGNGFLGYTLTVRAGCRGAVKTLSTVAPANHLLVGLPLPLEWRLSPPMVAGALDLLYGSEHERSLSESGEAPLADASLRWLRDVHGGESLGSSLPFETIRAYRPEWEVGTPELPDSQLVVLRDPDDRALLQRLMTRGDETARKVPTAETRGGPYGALLYRAHEHGTLKPAGLCGRWQLWTTGHAVAAHDAASGTWSWVYVSSERSHPVYASVFSTGCMADLVVVEPFLRTDERALLVIDPDQGRVGRMKMPPDALWSFVPERQQLRVGGGIWALDDLRVQLAVPAP